MGWFIGISGQNQSLNKQFAELHPKPLFIAEYGNFYIAGGGLPQTTHYKKQENSSGWFASGIGISNDENPRFLDDNLWEDSIANGAVDLHQLNGHFAVAKWASDKVELVADQLGMRNIFVHKGKDFVLFTTRLDWLIKLVPNTSINWKKFGSRWMAINQFSSESFIDEVQQLSQGGHAIITQEKVTLSNKRWTFTEQKSSPEQFKKSLFNFTTIALNENRPLSLGLSGGLDSRTLFASLLSQPNDDWRLHTFGEQDHPDLQTAKTLNAFYGRSHHIFHEVIPPAQELVKMIPDFVGQTLFTSSPSHLVGFQAYQKIAELNLSVVDGGFGEIARRRFLASLLLRGKQALLNKNIDGIMPFMRLQKADIFTEDCKAEMEEGFRTELSTEIDAMPGISEIGIENWLDLFSIRTRVPNGTGPEQARSDSYLFNYLPFLQPQLIQQALNLPLQHRKNAKLFREIISEQAPALQKTDLVKGSVSYPYWMKDFSSAVWMRLKQKAGREFKSTHQADFLFVLEEYVRDLFSSNAAKNFPEYDQKKIHNLITGFYDDKNINLANELNWLLAFEVFVEGS